MLSLETPLASAFDWYENYPAISSGTDLDRAWIAIEELAVHHIQSGGDIG